MCSKAKFNSSFQGTLIQHLKEHVILGNLSQDDIILYYTTVSNEKWL
jgi:acetoacetyl-CoA synthetase